jgi:hypothetical protein
MLGVALALAASVAGCGDGNGDCAPGERGCACLPPSRCEGDLVCDRGLCQRTDETQLVIEAEGARACELVLEDSDARVANVRFVASSQGTFLRRGRRTAVAFIASQDVALEGSDVRVGAVGGNASTITVAEAACFDRDGRPIDGAAIEVR